jgi:hypothetical protein
MRYRMKGQDVDAIQVLSGVEGMVQVRKFVGGIIPFSYEAGDWVVKNARGEFWVIPDDRFHSLFEAC